jgi:hypothetical protein
MAYDSQKIIYIPRRFIVFINLLHIFACDEYGPELSYHAVSAVPYGL